MSGLILNNVGGFKMIAWMADPKSPCVFEQRSLCPTDRESLSPDRKNQVSLELPRNGMQREERPHPSPEADFCTNESPSWYWSFRGSWILKLGYEARCSDWVPLRTRKFS